MAHKVSVSFRVRYTRDASCGERSISTSPIRMARSYRLPGRSDDLGTVTTSV